MKSEQTNLQHYYSEIIVYYVAGVAVISIYITNKFDDLSLKRSEWRKSHYSSKPKAELNNDLFSTRAEPELNIHCYFTPMSN